MIRLRFIEGKDLASKAIAWFSQGHMSHVDCLLPDGRLLGARSDVRGDIPPGVQIRPGDYVKNVPVVLMGIPCAPSQEETFYDFLYGCIDAPYDHEAIWGFAFNRDWRDPSAWICSELQAAALEHSGISPRLYLAANKITPVALALAVSAMGGYVM